MNLAQAYWLLADRSLFRDMGSGFREKRQHFDGTDILLWILLAIGFFVFVGFLSRLLARSDSHQLFNSPRRLFRALCRAHRLDRSARRLLVQIAQVHQLDQPAHLFLQPGRFQLEPLPATLAGKKNAIAALAARLFPPVATAPATSRPAGEPAGPAAKPR
jgi:hypothetical protein